VTADWRRRRNRSYNNNNNNNNNNKEHGPLPLPAAWVLHATYIGLRAAGWDMA
jgi:hypothetical protein